MYKKIRGLFVAALVASLLSGSVAFAGARAKGSSVGAGDGSPTTQGLRLQGS